MKTEQQPYETLCGNIEALLQNNDRFELWQIKDSELYSLLTNEQKNCILEKLEEAEIMISYRLKHGIITPMDIDSNGRTRSVYIEYLCYLKYSVYKENREKAKSLAFEVYKCMLLDDNIDNKEIFDDYFSLLLAWEEKENAFKKRTRLYDRALHGEEH